ncbi:MAG: nuclear transport factor 2 family protein [Halobellus sp.]|uniref:nuclear transport factor 2 family protein n=1 Tax=Halobellus sp. TaxID=1979212 RepID=UPI0035D4238A
MSASEQTARERLHEYYAALRNGEPLYPFFVEDPAIVKYGITEKLTGYAEVEAGLRAQSASTAAWSVESHDLRVTERDEYAWFADDVRMAWTDTERDRTYDFESRWSGTLERRTPDSEAEQWLFVGMHVSAVPDTDLAE